MPRELEGGLILRSVGDGDDRDAEKYLELDPGWVDFRRVYVEGAHPTVSRDNVWVVVDPAKDNRVVSALVLIPQTWSYESQVFPVGRIEAVLTDPEYRQRGLNRALMEAAHAQSAELGHAAQVISGRANYYERFGYTQTVEVYPWTQMPVDTITPLQEGEQEPYKLREATQADIPTLDEWNAYASGHHLLTRLHTEQEWKWELYGSHRRRQLVRVIQRADGVDVGYGLFGQTFGACYSYVVGPKASYLETYDSLMREMLREAEASAQREGRDRPTRIGFIDGPSILSELTRPSGKPRDVTRAWYIRPTHLPDMIKRIAPVLERRLEGSAGHRYTGSLSISFYDSSCLRMEFDDGRLSNVLEVDLGDGQEADAHFPPNTFLRLVFGYRSLKELEYAHPDCFAGRVGTILLEAMFPKKKSMLNALW